MSEPVAYVIEWTAHDGMDPGTRRRLAWHGNPEPWMPNAKAIPLVPADELAALRARVAELEADAARYRFLRDRSYCHPRGIDSPREVGIVFEWQQARPDEDGVTIDEAIDAARLSGNKEGSRNAD